MSEAKTETGGTWFTLADGAGFALVMLAGLGGLSMLVWAFNAGPGMGVQDRIAAGACIEACGTPAVPECVRACMCTEPGESER